MTLIENYKNIKRSIVAFAPKYVPVRENTPPPLFPPIIGTGFIAREDGIIITNDHVVQAFSKVYKPPDAKKDDWGVYALLFHMIDAGQVEIPLQIIGAARIDKFFPGAAYYGPQKPDVAFVHVKVRGVPCLKINSELEIVEGLEVATAGYPMGSDALTAPGYVHQITPTLQRGIVSAVLPFSCSLPHAFTINIMTQGGASGSPVFDLEFGNVLGVLYAGLNDLDKTEKNDVYRVPTNISYVVPSHYILSILEEIGRNSYIVAPSDAQTIPEMLSDKTLINALDKGRKYDIKEIKLNNNIERPARLMLKGSNKE